MDFSFSDEQEELRRVVRRFLAERSPMIDVRRLMETPLGYDPGVWHEMAGPLALQGLTIAERYGGQGGGSLELTVVLEEMGRALFCGPYFATVVLAVNAIDASEDTAAMADYLPGIAGGATVATVAIAEDEGRWNGDGIHLAARPERDGRWILDGHKMYVIDGHIASLVLVFARTGNGLSLFAVEGDAPGLTREPFITMDLTRKQARLKFTGTSARLIGQEGQGERILSRILDRAMVALAAEEIGGAQRCLEMSVEYAKARHQFGRPIGTFQAIKHKCADILLEVESAKSAAYFASWAVEENSEDLPAVASMTKACCSDAFYHAAAENIQIHGGLGYTWDNDAHLYFKRAKSSDIIFGDAPLHRETFLQRLGI